MGRAPCGTGVDVHALSPPLCSAHGAASLPLSQPAGGCGHCGHHGGGGEGARRPGPSGEGWGPHSCPGSRVPAASRERRSASVRVSVREPRPRAQLPLCPRSTRACCCGACPWWAGTTATRTARRCHRFRTSTCRWTTSCGCRAPATASSPASPCCAVSPGPGCARLSCVMGPPQAQPLSLSSGSPILLWQPGPGVQDLPLLGDATTRGRWRRRGRPRAPRAGRGPAASALGPGTWGPLAPAITGWGLRVAGGDQVVSLPAKAE